MYTTNIAFLSSDTGIMVISCAITLLFILLIARLLRKKVPKDTVYIIDRRGHYYKTVKKGSFHLNPNIDEITTIISKKPIKKKYAEPFETEDGKYVYAYFNVTYSTENLEDVLYNLEKVRRSVDDILETAMYDAIGKLTSKELTEKLLYLEFKRNLESEAMSMGFTINDFEIERFFKISKEEMLYDYGGEPFKPHKNYSNSKDPIEYS